MALEHADLWPSWMTPVEESGQWVVLAAHCTVSRNLSGFPFPAQCHEDERDAIQRRILEAFDHINLFHRGKYYAAADLDTASWQFLAERRLITREWLHGQGTRGAYIAEDHAAGIMINGTDHLVIRSLAPGIAAQQAWEPVSRMIDDLARFLDFTYQERLGFLTSRLGMVGTGLRIGILLHLPALAESDLLEDQAGPLRTQGLELHGLVMGDPPGAALRDVRPAAGFSAADEDAMTTQSLLTDLEGGLCSALSHTVGDLYLLVNQDTLGLSEEDILFRVTHGATELVGREEQARQELYRRDPMNWTDRVARARALACGARLVTFAEALEWLSLLRFGGSLGMAPSVTPALLNELTIALQAAHLTMRQSDKPGDFSLSVERANLLRKRLQG